MGCSSTTLLELLKSVCATRLAVTFTITLMVISSPIFIVVNPSDVSAATTDNINKVDISNYHSTPQISETSSSTPTSIAPSTLSQDGDFTTQAALSLTRATQTNNIVNTKSYYDIAFRTSTTGIIQKIQMAFPPGTSLNPALLVEAVGIGPGTIAASGTVATGQTITYTVTNPATIPANTKIRIELSNILNPQIPGTKVVTITTRNTANVIIDGPTQTLAYFIKQIGTGDIADNAVTTPKIADGAIIPEVIQRAGAITNVPASSAVLATAFCQVGEEVVAGGHFVNDAAGYPFMILAISESVGGGWDILMRNNDPANAHTFQPEVQCMPAMP